jgi:hypothetical protein
MSRNKPSQPQPSHDVNWSQPCGALILYYWSSHVHGRAGRRWQQTAQLPTLGSYWRGSIYLLYAFTVLHNSVIWPGAHRPGGHVTCRAVKSTRFLHVHQSPCTLLALLVPLHPRDLANDPSVHETWAPYAAVPLLPLILTRKSISITLICIAQWERALLAR